MDPFLGRYAVRAAQHLRNVKIPVPNVPMPVSESWDGGACVAYSWCEEGGRKPEPRRVTWSGEITMRPAHSHAASLLPENVCGHGLMVLSVGVQRTHGHKASSSLATSFPNCSLHLSHQKFDFNSYYKGGFEMTMSRREAGLILGCRYMEYTKVGRRRKKKCQGCLS